MLHSWKAFGYIVVNYLGLNQSFMPLYEAYPQKKAERIINLIFEEGNFGHHSSKSHYSHIYLLRKLYSLYDNMLRMINLASLFPTDAIRNVKNPWNSFERIYQDFIKNRYYHTI